MLRVSTHLRRRILIASVATAGVFAGCSNGPAVNRMVSSANETTLSETRRDLDEPSKLSPALQRLADGSETARDIGTPDSSAPGPNEVGTPVPGTKDLYQVVIHVTPEIDLKALAAAGAFVQSRIGNIIYATVHAHDLPAVADVPGIVEIDPIPGGRLPTPPRGGFTGEKPRGDLGTGTTDSLKFDHHGLSGKGVIVGVIDTGIDWKHPDFIKPDGTSRIKYLWDVFDNTWEKSNHTIGSAPPKEWEAGKPMGTLYTNDQINQALKGDIKISRPDKEGHGTACAGTAAGNGLGVAQDAELVFVSTHDDDGPEGNDGAGAPVEAEWIKEIAAAEHKPCVISLSFGGSMNPHDGTGDWPEAMDEILDHGKALGLVVCVSAGNDGTHSMHARGRFGPAIENELSGGMSAPIELIVTSDTFMTAYFDSKDDWGMLIEGDDKFLVGTDNKPGYIKLAKKSLALKNHSDLVLAGADNLSPTDRSKIKVLYNKKQIDAGALSNGTDQVVVSLPPGTYSVAGGGHSKQVTKGVFDLYLPDAGSASFGKGGDHKMVIGSPGDAESVITVGSYDCCNTWDSLTGSTFSGQVNLGNISSFSSAGFRRDGAIKPDLAAPGDFMISTFAAGSALAEGDPTITKDGKHVAWRGTSAACPYTAGVVALMLEKNAQLTANQAKQILHDTASHDLDVTGAVPNGEWGYGKLDAEKALAAVPAGVPVAPVVTPAPPTPTPTPVTAANSNFVGTFKGEDMTIQLVAATDGFTGEMTRGDKVFPLTAKAKDNHLDGTATSGGQDFSFSADLDGDKLTVTANNKTFDLTRQAVGVNPFK